MPESRANKTWTPEEEAYLQDKWGHMSVATLCKKLGRSKNAILVRVNRIGLLPFYESGEYVTLNRLYQTFRGRNVGNYQLKSWIQDRGLPVHNKRRGSFTARVVYLDEFWTWAEQNRSFLDFSKLEPLALGAEPAWVPEQRRKDARACAVQRKDPWTLDEDRRLSMLVKQHRYGYAELSQMLHRSEGAIQRRLTDLGIKDRPVRVGPHDGEWTDAHFAILADGIRNGDSYARIGQAIGKSEKAVRGKVYHVYLTEKADKVRAMMGAGVWGDGAPIPTVRQGANHARYRTQVRRDLSMLDAILRKRMNDLGYEPFWQRHMCQHWDDIKGCGAGCTDCDACTEFRRIRPQFCARCGGKFFERQENRFCSACRTARKKKGFRKWLRQNPNRFGI